MEELQLHDLKNIEAAACSWANFTKEELSDTDLQLK